jgi:hypothetical protein
VASTFLNQEEYKLEADILEWQIQQLEAAEFYLGDYYAFLTEVVPYDFRQIRDPQVQQNLRDFGDIVLDWIQTYKCMNKMCLRYMENSDLTEHYRKIKDKHVCQYQTERRLVLQEHPRGTCKSAGVTKVAPSYIHAHLPEVAGGIMSAEYDRMGKKFSGAVRQIWEGLPGGKLNDLFGPYVVPKKNKSWTDEKMYTARRKDQSGEATLNCFSIETGAGGFHLKYMFVDDPITRALVRKYGDNWFDKVWDEFQEWDTVVDDDGLLVITYTRYGQADLAGKIRSKIVEPKVKRKLGELPEDFEERYSYYAKRFCNIDVLATQAFHYDEDRKIQTHYPTIWPPERIQGILDRGAKGEEWVWTQLQNRPWSSKNNPINEALLDRMQIEWDDIPPRALYDLTIHTDTAHATPASKDRGDESVISVWAHDGKGNVYWVWGWCDRATKHEFARQWVRAVEWCYSDKIVGGQTIPGVEPRIVTIDVPRGGEDPDSAREFLTGTLHKRGIPGVPVHSKKSYTGMIGKDQKTRAIKDTFGYLQDGRCHVVNTVEPMEAWFNQIRHIDDGGDARGLDDIADANKDVFLANVYTQPEMASSSSVKGEDYWGIEQPIETGYYRGDRFVPVTIGGVATDDGDDFSFGGF